MKKTYIIQVETEGKEEIIFMILTVDVGNTNITLGAYEGDVLQFISRLATDSSRTDDQYAIELTAVLRLHAVAPEGVESAVIGSVVPELTGTLYSAVHKLTGVPPLVVGSETETGLRVLLENPSQLGADLAAGAIGLIGKYELPAMAVDLGSATKMYVVDAEGGYHGGMIAPGVRISLDALASRCSQLPTVSLRAPSKAVCTETVEAIQSGSILGTASMIDGMIDRFSEEMGEMKTVVATGGLAKCIIPHCRRKVILDENLILDGLRIIYETCKNKD